MTLKRKSDLDRIIMVLSYLRAHVEHSVSQNLNDINIYSENFFRDFLNRLLDCDLENINIGQANAAAIDLGDETQKIAIQVTATNDLAKIKKTVTKFVKNNLHMIYDRLIVLIITKKKNYTTKFIGDKKDYELNISTDVWDVSDLIRLIGDLESDEIEKIRSFLDSEIKFENTESIPKEIATFQVLIATLSDEGHPGVGSGSFLEEPDPKGKIEERFIDHTDFLKSQFQELYAEFGLILKDVRDNSDLGQVKLRRLSLHLKDQSDHVLSQCHGDAKKALDRLVNEMSDMCSEQGAAFDKTAVRFFLLDELIRCNVFPNKEHTNTDSTNV